MLISMIQITLFSLSSPLLFCIHEYSLTRNWAWKTSENVHHNLLCILNFFKVRNKNSLCIVKNISKYVITKWKADTFNLIAGGHIYLKVCNVSCIVCRLMISSKWYLNIFDRLICEMFTVTVLTFTVQDISVIWQSAVLRCVTCHNTLIYTALIIIPKFKTPHKLKIST